MDELGSFVNDSQSGSRARQALKRKSCPPPVMSSVKRRGRPPKHSINTSDEGIGSFTDPLNDSIAESVKRRKRVVNSKQFDSQLFLDSVVDQIEHKYKNKGKDDAIIDLQNMQIIDKKGFVEQRVRTEIGYFADNTLEDLRQNSFRNKDLISCPLIASTPSTAQIRRVVAQRTDYNQMETIDRERPQTSASRAIQLRNANKICVKPVKSSLTDIIIASDDDSEDDMIVSHSMRASDEESVVSNQSEELDENHPFIKYENKILLIDKDYQIVCFNKTIEVLKNDRNHRFREALKLKAKQTIGLPSLPSGDNLIPIIKFNSKGEPGFEFYFQEKNSPQIATEVLRIDQQIIYFSKIIYEWLILPQRERNSSKRLSYNRRQLEFNN